jgi:hypothetical protein
VKHVAQTGAAIVRTTRNNFMNTLGQLQTPVICGMTRTWLISGFVALTSVSLILIARSGIYLWFKTLVARLTGGVLRAFSLSYGSALIVALSA